MKILSRIIVMPGLLPNWNKSKAKTKELETHIWELVKAFQDQVQAQSQTLSNLIIQMTKIQTTQSTQIIQIIQIQAAQLAETVQIRREIAQIQAQNLLANTHLLDLSKKYNQVYGNPNSAWRKLESKINSNEQEIISQSYIKDNINLFLQNWILNYFSKNKLILKWQ